MKLSDTMIKALRLASDRGGLIRLRGGWWVGFYDAPEGYKTVFVRGMESASTQTVHALVERGLLHGVSADKGAPDWKKRYHITDAGCGYLKDQA